MSNAKEQALRLSLLWVGMARVVLVSVGLVLTFVHPQQAVLEGQSSPSVWHYLAVALAYGYSLVGILILRKSKYLWVLAHVQLVADTCVVTLVVLATGGVESVFTFIYVLVVLEGSIVLLRPGAWVAAASCSMFYGTVVVLQFDKGLPPVLNPAPSVDAFFAYFIHTLGVVLVAILSSQLATKLKKADELLAEQEEDLAWLSEMQGAILRALPAGLLTVGPDGIIKFGNESAHHILHVSLGSLVQQKLSRFLSPVSEVLSQIDLNRPERPLRSRHEASVELNDGTQIRIGFSLAPLLREEQERAHSWRTPSSERGRTGSGERTAKSGRPSLEQLESSWPASVLRTRKDSVNVQTSAPKSHSSSIEGTVIIFQDVTEIVRLEEAVSRSEQLALVGRFAAGLAHEVRNPLAAMCASIDVLEQKLRPPPEMERLMRNIVHEAGRLEHLIQDFLTLARPQQLGVTRVEIGELLEDVLAIFRNDRLMSNVNLEFHRENFAEAALDHDLVRQVVWNLLRNSAEALQEVQAPMLRVTVEVGVDGPQLTIADNGPGMSEESLKHALEPFYTTKRNGSGLGLAITQSIIQAHGGEFELQSLLGQGTVAVVRFPKEHPSLPPCLTTMESESVSEVR